MLPHDATRDPRNVSSDKQAFEQILERLRGDVGTLLKLIAFGVEQKLFDETAPFWALARMMFPVAESIGDLIFREDSTAKNLTRFLKEECEAVRPGYREHAAVLALLFRHSLTHTDELRNIRSGVRMVGWQISWNEPKEHLQKDRRGPNFFRLKFDTTAFYEDLVEVLLKAIDREWHGAAMMRYNSWMTLSLDRPKLTATEKEAIKEIESFTGVCPFMHALGLDATST